MASACEESSCLKSGTITDRSLPLSQNISQLLYTPFSCSPYHLFVTCFFHFPARRKREAIPVCKGAGVDSSLPLSPPLPPPSPLTPPSSTPPHPLLCREGPGRCTDWWERMIYVASVSRLSSGPLSLIIAISFSHCSLVCAGLWKSSLFSHIPHQESLLILLPHCHAAAFSAHDRQPL